MSRQKTSLAAARAEFHRQLLASVMLVDEAGVPTNADKASAVSRKIAVALVKSLGRPKRAGKVAGQELGNIFEDLCRDFLVATFPSLPVLRPGSWNIEGALGGIDRFEQFEHLALLKELCKAHPELAASLGKEHVVLPDIVISRNPEEDKAINRGPLTVDGETARHAPIRKVNNDTPILHASVSCKWTLRSDRAQNARTEALNLIRNRKGRVPHIVAITGEPLPSRIASLALGTGDLDCVYHVALPELIAAVEASGHEDALTGLKDLMVGRRLRDIADLPLDLCV